MGSYTWNVYGFIPLLALIISIVVVFAGYEMKETRKDVKKTMNIVEEKYSNVLREWGGSIEKLKDIGIVIKAMIG